jgi:hypothetical protein
MQFPIELARAIAIAGKVNNRAAVILTIDL